MKAQRPSYSWVKDTELDKKGWISASPNGWTDNVLGVNWLELLFEPLTSEK
jgi:hypothetical protein